MLNVPVDIIDEVKRSHLIDGIPRATTVNAAMNKIQELEDS